MRRFFLPLFIAFAAGGAAFIIATAGDLPAHVASHFGRSEEPSAWTACDTWVVVAANTSVPPQLPDRPFQVLIAGFIAAMCIWTAVLCVRFRRPG